MPTSPDTGTAEAAGDPDKLDRAVLLVAGVVVLGAIMSILDITIVTVAQPAFQNDFGATPAQVAWSMTGYTLALAAVIPMTGWAADRFGTKRLYLLAILLFTLGSILCATAWDVRSLVGFRVLQGLGGGMLAPLGMMILTRAAGPDRIGRVMAVMGMPMLLGPIFGPVLGGWLIDVASWHWIFLINVPIGLALIVTFVVRTLKGRAAHPLIDLELFRDRTLTLSLTSLLLFGVAFFGASLLFPSCFLQVRGETTLNAGLLLAPQGIGAMIVMPIAGILVDRFGAGGIIMAGVSLIAVGLGMFSTVDANTSYVFLGAPLFIMGMGTGATMMPIMTAALQTLKPHQIARGSTLTNITQQVAASIGTAVLTVVLTANLRREPLAQQAIAAQFDPTIADRVAPDVLAQGLDEAANAFGNSFVVAAVLVILVLVPAFFLPRGRRDPAAAEADWNLDMPEDPDPMALAGEVS